MNRRDYLREQIKNGNQLVTAKGGNEVRPESESSRETDASRRGAKISKHDWGI